MSPWYPSDVAACTGSVSSKYGTEVRSFPISIMKGGNVYPGVMMVVIMELW
jgi:hypothetical protein